MKRLIILALTLTVGLSACDVLDLEPKDRVTQFDYFKTANDLELFSNPFYNNLLDKEYRDYGNVAQPGIWVVAGVAVKIF